MIAEIGVDPDEQFAHPVTEEVLRAADVIVMMGHSVGVIDIPKASDTRTCASAIRSAPRSPRSAACAPTLKDASETY